MRISTTTRTVSALVFSAIVAIGAAGPLLAARGNVHEVRFGTTVGADGTVPADGHSDHFEADATIHVTMRVQGAARGTKLSLTILDRQTEGLVWSEEQLVPAEHANMHFIPGNLRPGKYRAKVKLGDDQVAEHDFVIG